MITIDTWTIEKFIMQIEEIRAMVEGFANYEETSYGKGKLTNIALDLSGAKAKFEALRKDCKY